MTTSYPARTGNRGREIHSAPALELEDVAVGVAGISDTQPAHARHVGGTDSAQRGGLIAPKGGASSHVIHQRCL